MDYIISSYVCLDVIINLINKMFIDDNQCISMQLFLLFTLLIFINEIEIS